MENEKPLPLPLSGDEIRAGILAKIEDSFTKSCHLKVDNAYTSVKAEIRIRLTLDDYGREVKDNHNVDFEQAVPELLTDSVPRTTETNITIEPQPPNVFRVENGLSVPIKVVEGKKTIIKNVHYSPRKGRGGIGNG